jgi:hypothetical protein
MIQGYITSGGFTFKQKLWATIKENLIFYGVLLTIAVAAIIYIVVTEKLDM